MKKRLIFIGCIILLGATLSSCGGNTDKSNKIKEDNETSYINVSKLPYDMKYNNKTIPLSEVDVYQMESNYGHTLYATAKLDITSIDDKDLHWLDKESKNWTTQRILNTKFKISNGDNALKDSDLTCIGSCNFGDSLVYYYISLDELKNEFSQLSIDFEVNLEQDEVYDKNKRHKENRYTYSKSYATTDEIKDIRYMPENIKTNLTKVMNQFKANLNKSY